MYFRFVLFDEKVYSFDMSMTYFSFKKLYKCTQYPVLEYEFMNL